jgi:FkbM family methyltransferase
MTFVSYAQNYEDVLLHRALRDVVHGFYIDAGAWHPDIDSVTRAFYERGWRGINIEPVADHCRRLAMARPDDVTLHLALGAAAEEAELFVLDGTGLSTLQPALLGADAQRARRVRVRVETLAAVCRAHAPPHGQGEIHFLKIDVEGNEGAVLAGADFTMFRPWIVLIEATAPQSTLPTHAEWEPMLRAANYRFVWFDGLNRFYVAAERHTALAPHFETPPNVFDDFVRVGDSDLVRRIVAAETAAAERQLALDAAARQHQAQAAALAAAQRTGELRAMEAAALRAVLAEREARLGERAAEIAALHRRAALAEEWLANMRASTSWRLTAPLRQAAARLGRGRMGDATPVSPDPVEQAPAAVALPPYLVSGSMRTRHTVHQFHAGSATGDAITNAMLLTRGLLRALGFTSDIYTAHPHPALAQELRPLEELPRHDGYVLILRHSMGFEAFEHVAALPAAKVLLYHNITPSALLAEDGPLRDYARLGRAQLARLRPLVTASLADSEYNAAELRALGFDAVRTCTLLFDPASLRDRAAAAYAAAPRAADAPFTVLFVGRVTRSKGQHELLAAYVRFRARLGRPARLVLVGRHTPDAYTAELCRAIDAEGLGGEAVLAGLVTDAALDAWYAQADLYVSLSEHEGFGVPLVEAMAHGVPVLAWPAGAVPYTLGGAGVLLSGRDAETVAAAMLALAEDPAARAGIAVHQAAMLDRFAPEKQMPVLLAALARAGALPPPDTAARAALAANLHITLTGHIGGSYSLAGVNRALATALAAHAPGRVRLRPAPGEIAAALPEAERAALAPLLAQPPPPSGPHIALSQHYPPLPPDTPADVALALVFWEESLLPAAMVTQLNRDVRAVLAPTAFVARALLDSGVTVPVRVVGHAPALDAFIKLHATRGQDRNPATPFTFLHVSSCFPRKGLDVLLAAFARAFRAADRVRLVIKGFPNPHNDAAERIARLQVADPAAPEIVLIDRDLDDAALLRLYAEADAMVLPSRGEGFNLPAAEAMAAGLPVIVTGHGGHMDFCDAATARLLRMRFVPSRSHLASPHSLWAEPDADDLVAALRTAVTPAGRAEAAARAATAAARIAGLGAKVAACIEGAALDVLLAPPAVPPRLAWVSTWDVRCGVAEYSRALLDALGAAGGFAAIAVFADRRTAAVEADAAGRAIVPCWRRGEAKSVDTLATALAAADPDVVMVQHQPALFGWDGLATLLDARALVRRVVAVTLHNTRHLLEIETAERARVLAALAGAARVLVHTPADLDLLHDLGLMANVSLLPHGAPAPAAGDPPARPLPPSAAPLIGCYGFFLPGKGIPELIAALGKLRATWAGARLRLVNAAYDAPESAAEIDACRAAAAALGLAGAIEWQTDFLPHAQSLALLGGCDVVALPYQASKEASSAALRTALAAGTPVLVTPLPLFDEAAEAVARAEGIGSEALAAALGTLLGDQALRDRMRKAARTWLAARVWDSVGARLGALLRGLHASAACHAGSDNVTIQ